MVLGPWELAADLNLRKYSLNGPFSPPANLGNIVTALPPIEYVCQQRNFVALVYLPSLYWERPIYFSAFQRVKIGILTSVI